MQSHPLYHWLILEQAEGLGPITLTKLLQHFKTIAELIHAPHATLKALGIKATLIDSLKNPNPRLIETALRWQQMPNHFILSVDDARYPSLLRQIPDPPLLLYGIGPAELLTQPQLAIVGSRNPTALGKQAAESFAAELSLQQLIITSGLALGIDAAAHQGALKVNKPTIAVLGCGLNTIYPLQHRPLAQQILLKGGVLLSEFPLCFKPRRAHFPQRNRIISGLSLGTLVVEAALKSGSLITAKFAGDQNREVFAIPGSIYSPLSRGCHELLKNGAKLAEDVTDILQELNISQLAATSPVATQTPGLHSQLDSDQAKLLECVPFETVSLENLLDNSGLALPGLTAQLLILELHGYIKKVPGGYSRVRA